MSTLDRLMVQLGRDIDVRAYVQNRRGKLVPVVAHQREFEVFSGTNERPSTKDELSIVESLKELGGERVAWRGPDADSHIIATRGQEFDGESLLKPGKSRECHANTSVLWSKGKVDHIATGYALSADGVWRQHTWGLQDSGEVVETTLRRERYFGVVLTDDEASKFAKANSL